MQEPADQAELGEAHVHRRASARLAAPVLHDLGGVQRRLGDGPAIEVDDEVAERRRQQVGGAQGPGRGRPDAAAGQLVGAAGPRRALPIRVPGATPPHGGGLEQLERSPVGVSAALAYPDGHGDFRAADAEGQNVSPVLRDDAASAVELENDDGRAPLLGLAQRRA